MLKVIDIEKNDYTVFCDCGDIFHFTKRKNMSETVECLKCGKEGSFIFLVKKFNTKRIKDQRDLMIDVYKNKNLEKFSAKYGDVKKLTSMLTVLTVKPKKKGTSMFTQNNTKVENVVEEKMDLKPATKNLTFCPSCSINVITKDNGNCIICNWPLK